jgi:hypothetical protein
MIIILTKEGDLDATEVSQILSIRKINFKRVNTFTQLEQLYQKFYLSNTREYTCWFRKPIDLEEHEIFNLDLTAQEKIFLLNERKSIVNSLYQILIYNAKSYFGYSEIYEPPKIKQLIVAKKVGFDIPNFFISTSKNEIISEINISTKKKLLTKYLSNSPMFVFQEYSLKSYASVITVKDLEKFSEIVPSSFFQEFISPKVDLRVVLVNNCIYGVKIDDENYVDIRQSKKRMFVPIIINRSLKNLIIQFSKNFGLNFACFDLLFTKNSVYFLEANPFGQFGFVSKTGNYKIHELICDILQK